MLQNLSVYITHLAFLPAPVYSPSLFLPQYYQGDLSKMQSWSSYFSFPPWLKTAHWIPTAFKRKYQHVSIAPSWLALPVSYYVCLAACTSVILKRIYQILTFQSDWNECSEWIPERTCSFKHLHLCTSSSLDSARTSPRKLCSFSLRGLGKFSCCVLIAHWMNLSDKTVLLFYDSQCIYLSVL